MGRFFLCLVVAWSCIALVVRVQGRAGLASGLGGKIRPVSAPHFHVVERGVRAGSSWSSTSLPAQAAAAELRSVPAGPDPMHHHGSPRLPEHDAP